MEEIYNKLKAEIDYEKQLFEDMESNSYEIAVASAKYAREINDRSRKFFGSEVYIQPRNLAMKRLESDDAKIIYAEEEKEKTGESSVEQS